MSCPVYCGIISDCADKPFEILLINRERKALLKKEYGRISVGDGITRYSIFSIPVIAAKTGGIIMSAAIILSATFAALYSAQITSLAELATAVIIGLLLLAFVFMPIFMPACMALTDKIKTRFKPDKPIPLEEPSDPEQDHNT